MPPHCHRQPAEGCTLRVEVQPRNEAPRRLERKFDGDDTGAGPEVARRRAARDCFQDWRLYRVDVHPEVVSKSPSQLKRWGPQAAAAARLRCARGRSRSRCGQRAQLVNVYSSVLPTRPLQR